MLVNPKQAWFVDHEHARDPSAKLGSGHGASLELSIDIVVWV